MIVADTSVWIEFFKGNNPYFKNLQRLLEQGQLLGVELVFAELLQGAKNKREQDVISRYWTYIPKAPINHILIEAGTLSSNLKLHAKGVGLIDVSILVYSRKSKAKLWTLDKKLLKICTEEELFHL